MKVKSIAECTPLGAFCNTFDLHLAIIGLEKPILGLFESAILDRFYSTKNFCSVSFA